MWPIAGHRDMSQTHAQPIETPDDLLALVKRDPRRPGAAFARLAESETPVWAVILHMTTFGGVADVTKATGADIADAADAYRISDREVRAAIAYYAANRAPIDARLLLLADG
jgi:hypothetical protein